MTLPKFLQSTLWSYDLKSLDIKKDKNIIITQILNHGSWQQIQWLRKQYSLREITNVISNPGKGLWYSDVLNYWQIILGINLSKKKIQQALFSLTPR